MPRCCCSTTTTRWFATPGKGFPELSSGGGGNPTYPSSVKAKWIHLPPVLVLALSIGACQPIERDPDGHDQPKRILQAGHFARTMIDNTSFFRQLPLSGGQADLLLQRHTSVRIIKLDPGYSKVELDSGEIGFVQTAMLEPMPVRKPDGGPDGPAVEDSKPDILDPIPPTGPGMPEVLPPTIDPE